MRVIRILLFIGIFAISCTTPSVKTVDLESTPTSLTSSIERLDPTYTQQSNIQDGSTDLKETKQTTSQKIVRKTKLISEKSCAKTLDKYKNIFYSLYKNLNNKNDVSENIQHVLTSGHDICEDEDERMEFINTLKISVTDHSRKIGVILPLTGINSFVGQEILVGIKSALKDLKINDSILVVRDNNSNPHIMEPLISELVLKEKVTAIVGGTSFEESLYLVNSLSGLKLPTLLLSQQKPSTIQKNVFNIYPREDLLIKKLVQHLQSRSVSRVAFLRPLNKAADSFLSQLYTELKSVNIEVNYDVHYSHHDYDSMESAAKKIFQIDNYARNQEYLALLEAEKAKAEAESVKFNPAFVSLSPIQDFDVVVIPDSFKVVRHFVNIFKFIGINKVPMVGNYEWKSRELIDPYDPFLEGSVFADFIGDYADLPFSIRPITDGQPFLVNPMDVRRVDYNLIGYHSSWIAANALGKTKKTRLEFTTIASKLKVKNARYFQDGPLFDENRATIWPSYIFKINNAQFKTVDF